MIAEARAKVARMDMAKDKYDFLREQLEMRVLGLVLAEHAISWSPSGKQRLNDKLLYALAKSLKAESQLRAAGALPTEAAAVPRMKNKTFKQLAKPTVDADELAEIDDRL
eukprot:6204316-Pleurochrysis_carterae.AAC.2